MPTNQFEVFISYARGGESEKIVEQLEAALAGRGLTFIRDKRDLGFKESITGFMKEMGAGRAVVVVISDHYLKSSYCMFELMQIYRNHDFIDRTFPVVLEDAAIFHLKNILPYIDFWKEQKTALESIISKRPDISSVINDDYKLCRKVSDNFGEVISEFRDIHALTPEMHRASHFQQLYEALLHRQEEDARFTTKREAQKLLNQLATGSQKYYDELTGINGPYHHLNISQEILAGISRPDAWPEPTNETLQTTVKNKESGGEFPLESCLQWLWAQGKPYVLLLADGGMGKTVSLINFWKALLKNRTKGEQETIPIFLTLHEYNMVSQYEQEGFIAKRMIWHYLGLRENRGEAIDTLWDVLKTPSKAEKPMIVLLLDGFNEVTADSSVKTQLLLELKELQEKGNAVQLVLSSRYEMNFTWAQTFQTLELQPLDDVKVKGYLKTLNIGYPSNQKFRQILKNPMMLTLHAGSCQIVEQYIGNKQFDFKPHTTTQGELLWNFLEAQIVKLALIFGLETPAFYYHKFLLRHFLPYIGYQMELTGRFVLQEKELKELVKEACRSFYCNEFIETWPAYGTYLAKFNLRELDFAEEAKRFEDITSALCRDLRLLKRNIKVYEFLHQSFRDYFATIHILNDVERELQCLKIPPTLTFRCLPVYLRKFIGQITGEQYKTGNPSSVPGVLAQTLDNLRGIFDETAGFATWNILNIWIDTRSDLGEADLSNLNLLKVGFRMRLAIPGTIKGITARILIIA